MPRPVFRKSETFGSPAPQNNKNGFGVSIFNIQNIASKLLKNQDFDKKNYGVGKRW